MAQANQGVQLVEEQGVVDAHPNIDHLDGTWLPFQAAQVDISIASAAQAGPPFDLDATYCKGIDSSKSDCGTDLTHQTISITTCKLF